MAPLSLHYSSAKPRCPLVPTLSFASAPLPHTQRNTLTPLRYPTESAGALQVLLLVDEWACWNDMVR